MPGARIIQRRAEQLVALEADHRAPFRALDVAGHPDEGEGGDLEDGAADAERAGHDERRQRVGHDPPDEDAVRRFAERPRRRHVVVLLRRQHRRARDAGVHGYRDDADGDQGVGQARAGRGHDDDREEQRREGQDDVHEAHEDVVRPARHVAGQRADRRSDEDREADRGEADDERGPGCRTTTRLNTSRKLLSVPRIVLAAGPPGSRAGGCTARPARVTPGSTPSSDSVGSWVAIWSAKTAMNTSRPRMIRPTTADRWRRMLPSGVAPQAGCVRWRRDARGSSGELFAGGGKRWVHRSRTLGSRKPYEMSTTRLTTT